VIGILINFSGRYRSFLI